MKAINDSKLLFVDFDLIFDLIWFESDLCNYIAWLKCCSTKMYCVHTTVWKINSNEVPLRPSVPWGILNLKGACFPWLLLIPIPRFLTLDCLHNMSFFFILNLSVTYIPHISSSGLCVSTIKEVDDVTCTHSLLNLIDRCYDNQLFLSKFEDDRGFWTYDRGSPLV